jgi:hypothetical protein
MTDATPSTIKPGYIVLSADGVRTDHVPVSSAYEASSTWRRFVESNDFGASALKHDSGFIYSNDGKLVAKVSYNGRVWTPTGELIQEAAKPTMTEPKIITASLEGMRIVIDKARCTLEEYDFSVNQWSFREHSPWPLDRLEAERWLAAWNRVDRFAALNAITKPEDDQLAPNRGTTGQPFKLAPLSPK